MTKALEMPGAAAAERTEVPFYPAGDGPVIHACAAMMIGATISNEIHSADQAYLEQFTGIPADDRTRATTGARMLQSFADHGVSVNVISGVNYLDFALGKPDVLPPKIADRFRRMPDGAVVSEMYSTRLLLEKLVERSAYEDRPASIDDIGLMHEAGWVVKLDVNGSVLAGRRGFMPHPLVVTGVGDCSLQAHNPGNHALEAIPDQEIAFDELLPAWSSAGFVLHAVGRVRQMGSDILPSE